MTQSNHLSGSTVEAALLAATRVSMAGLVFWWGLARALDTGAGKVVSDTFYGGAFGSALLVGFGWLQVAAALALALGLWRIVLLPAQLVLNLSSAVVVAPYLIDPFWLYLPGDKPFGFGHLFYPSLIIVCVSALLIAFRDQDRFAWDARRART